ncbi:AMP-binding protein [Roseibium sp.]|uniref:AMP-binding protein n=1 Tax=Roseibium sp. TaxID=1936156 RepID=UPI003BACCE8B
MQTEGHLKEFWHSLESHGSRIALITSSKTVSFAELAAKGDAFSKDLADQAKGRKRLLIALVMSPNIDVIAAYLGALRAGHVILLCDCSILDTQNPIATRFGFDCFISFSEGELKVEFSSQGADTPVTLHEDLTLLLSTSGSTGEPKLVRLSAASVQSNASAIADYLELSADSRAITTLPMFYSYGMSVLHSQLTAGGALILTEASVTEPDFWETARLHGATSLALVPHQVQLIDRSAMSGYPLPDLKYVTQAGGRLPVELVRKMNELGLQGGWKFFVMYGQTEASPRIAYVPPEALPEAANAIGRAIPGGRLEIRADDGSNITEPGKPGELIYSGPNVMMGYASTDEELARGPETDFLSTGDLAEWTETGLARIVGRLKRFVKLYGMRVSLDQVETHLNAHGITAFAAGNDEHLVLFVDTKSEEARAVEIVSGLIGVPPSDILVSTLVEPPLLPSGKVDYKTLDRIAKEEVARQVRDPSSDKMDLREVMAQATRSGVVKDHESFQDLGGDSLGYLQVTMAIEARLGYLPEGWETVPVGELMRKKPAAKPRAEIGMDVIVRILAISLIVINHAANGGFNGGTWVLLMALGASFYRFQVPALETLSPVRVLLKMFYPVLPLYFLMVFALLAAGKDVPTPIITLTANLGSNDTAFIINLNWFISLYVQLVIFAVLLFSIEPLRRRTLQTPFLVTTTIFAISLVGSLMWQAWLAGWFDGVDHNLDSIYRVGSPLTCLPMVALGIMIAANQERERLFLLLGAVVLNTLVFPTLSIAHVITLLVGGAMLASGLVVRTPLWLGRVARQMAATALFVYLLHPIVLHFMRYDNLIEPVLGKPVYILLALLLSFSISWLVLEIFRWMEALALKTSVAKKILVHQR